MKRLHIFSYVCLFCFSLASAGLTAAEMAVVKTSANGEYYFKMSATGHRPNKMVGTAYHVVPGDRDEVLWRITGWFSDNVFLSANGTILVRVEEDNLYLYKNGRELASRSADSTSLGMKLLIDATRSGFSPDERDFILVTTSGKSEIFSLEAKKNGASEFVGLETIAKRVESTVSYDRSVRNYAEVKVKVEGQNRSSRSTVANSVSGKQSAATLIGVQTRKSEENLQRKGTQSSATVPVSKVTAERAVSESLTTNQATDPITHTGKYECKVEAQLFASATRKKVTSRRQIHQSGATRGMAADRAMAYCEGIVGAGSRMPRGRCELLECVDLTEAVVPGGR